VNVFFLFGLQMTLSFIVFAIIAKQYFMPWIWKTSVNRVLIGLLLIHAFRYVGLSVFTPGQVAAAVPNDFALELAYGDVATAVLAIISILLLTAGKKFMGYGFAWLTSIVGVVDLVNVNVNAILIEAMQYELGAVWNVATFVVPLLIVSHYLIIWVLLNKHKLKNGFMKPIY